MSRGGLRPSRLSHRHTVNSLLLLFVALGVPTLGVLVYALVTGSPGLRRHVLTRVALTIPMILILATVVFVVLRVLPGDPVTSSLGPRGNPEVREAMRDQLGLDLPIWAQYGRYLGSLFTFDLGNALTSGRPASRRGVGRAIPGHHRADRPRRHRRRGGRDPRRHPRRIETEIGHRLRAPHVQRGHLCDARLLARAHPATHLRRPIGVVPVAGRIDPIVSGSLERHQPARRRLPDHRKLGGAGQRSGTWSYRPPPWVSSSSAFSSG